MELAHHAAARAAIAGRQYPEARKHLELLMSVQPQEPLYYRLMADLEELQNRLSEARTLLDKALELDPEDEETLADLGAHHLFAGDRQQAEAYTSNALQLSPGHAGALVTMGHLLLLKGRTDEAREHAVWVLREQAGHVGALHLLAAAKARQSPVIGLWWRYNSAMAALGEARSVLVLLAAFLVYRIAMIAVEDAGLASAAQVIHWTWMAFVVYSFAGPIMFQRALRKELAEVQLTRDF
jgi:tetratricopeptide (TPR) repeat protein